MVSQRKIRCDRRGGIAVKKTRGFTLIEVMVALAVVAIALPALMVSLYQHVDATGHLRDKSLARMVAANKLEELRILSKARRALPSGEQTGVASMAGRDWYWTVTSEPTVSENLFQFEIDVAASELNAEAEQPLFTLVAYLSADLRTDAGVDNAAP
jgi:general secretion pathway protein I